MKQLAIIIAITVTLATIASAGRYRTTFYDDYGYGYDHYQRQKEQERIEEIERKIEEIEDAQWRAKMDRIRNSED